MNQMHKSEPGREEWLWLLFVQAKGQDGGQQADPRLGRLNPQTSCSLCSKKSFWYLAPEKETWAVTWGLIARGAAAHLPSSVSCALPGRTGEIAVTCGSTTQGFFHGQRPGATLPKGRNMFHRGT